MGCFAAMICFNHHLEFRLGPGRALAEKDPLYRFLGSFKEALGDTLFLKSDSYFHGGVEMDLTDRCEDEHSEEAHSNEQHHGLFKSASKDWISQVNDRVKVTEHSHLEGAEIKEILPLMDWAIRLDPYNTTAVLTCAYWLDKSFGKTDEAIDVLQTGLSNNPNSSEIASRLGQIYFLQKKDYVAARRALEVAAANLEADHSAPYQSREVYYFLAQSFLRLGNKQMALQSFQKANSFFDPQENTPIRADILKKIQSLTA